MTVRPGEAGAGPAPMVSVFVLTVPGIGGPGAARIVFQELVGLTSELDPTQYSSPVPVQVPPIVTLKRGLDGGQGLWQWHRLAVEGRPGARQQATLGMYAASDFAAGKPPVMSLILEDAWCARIHVGGGEAGRGDVVSETVQIVCDKISPA